MRTQTVKRPSRAVIRKVQSLRSEKGKIAVIDPETGDFFIGETLTEALQKAEGKYPAHVFYVIRIGYRAVYEHKGIKPRA